MEIKSKFKKSYYIGCLLQLILILGFIIFLFWFSNFNPKSDEFSFATLILLLSLIYIYRIILKNHNELIVNNFSITIRQIYPKKLIIILYTDILKFSLSNNCSQVDGIRISDGYSSLNIELKSGENLSVDPTQYENYEEMKAYIYEKTKEIWGY